MKLLLWPFVVLSVAGQSNIPQLLCFDCFNFLQTPAKKKLAAAMCGTVSFFINNIFQTNKVSVYKLSNDVIDVIAATW